MTSTAYTAGDWVLIISSLGAVITGAIAAIYAGRAHNASISNGVNIEKVHGEVRTLNGLTMGRLADNAETRRIDTIPVADRTDEEKLHVAVVPDPGIIIPKESET